MIKNPIEIEKDILLPPISQCEYNFKVYVYDIPQSLKSVQLAHEARKNGTLHVCQKCILEQFALEYIITDFFTQFCGRTYNPEEADFFYLPLIRDAEYRVTLSGSVRNRAPSNVEQALLHILEKNDSSLFKETFQISDKFWHRNQGGDHIIVMPAPVTNLRHETSRRGFFHYMMHFHPPIFLAVEYSIAFVREYPVCSTQKNIVVPYPTTDPDLYSGRLYSSAIQRNSLLYYAGGQHGDCIEVRRAMRKLMMNSTALPGVIPRIRSSQAEREHGFLAATFCPIPVGDSPSSKRMYDVLNFGCIPVVLSDDLVWAYTEQTGGNLKHNSFSIQLPQSVVHFTAKRTLDKYKGRKELMGILPVSKKMFYDILFDSCIKGEEFIVEKKGEKVFVNPLVQILQNIPKEDVDFLREGVAKVAPKFRYYQMNSSMSKIPTAVYSIPDGDAITVELTTMLQKRKDKGLAKLMRECKAERSRAGHQYISRYACDTNKQHSLL